MSVLTVLWHIFLVGVLVYVLAVLGLLISVGTENQRGNEAQKQQRQAEVAQARERARAREAAQRQQLLREWAENRVHDRRQGGA